MKQDQFSLLVDSGAVGRVVVVQVEDKWTVHGLTVDGSQIGNSTSSIETARGEIRMWTTLDAAYRFARAAGWRGVLVLTDSPYSASADIAAGVEPRDLSRIYPVRSELE